MEPLTGSGAPLDPRLVRSRHAADADAVLTASMNGVSDPFMIPYALALGATPFDAGLLSSVRNLLLAFVQLFSAEAVRRVGSRRRLVLVTAGFQALLWLPIAFAPAFGMLALPILIGAYTLGTASGALGGPAWGSLVADYTPAGERGRYFGRRARLVGGAATLSGAGAGLVLESAGGVVGFQRLCALAFGTRCLSWLALRRFHDEGWKEDPHLRFSFLRFLRATPRSNFARFGLCLAGSSFAAHLAAPFFAVYLLEGAGYGYAEYTAVVLGGSLAGMVSTPWWGHLGDRHGNHAVLRWTTIGVAGLPLLWIVSAHPLWMLVANMAGAWLWGGLNLSATNFVYDAVSPAKRHTCIAYFNVLNGVGVSLGAFCGGSLVEAWPVVHGNPFFVAFAASAALRFLAALSFRRWVREVRAVRQVGLREVVLDLVGQRLVGVLGLFSVRPEAERGRRPPRPPGAPAAPGAARHAGPAPPARDEPAVREN